RLGYDHHDDEDFEDCYDPVGMDETDFASAEPPYRDDDYDVPNFEDQSMEAQGYFHMTNLSLDVLPIYEQAAKAVGLDYVVSNEVYNRFGHKIDDGTSMKAFYVTQSSE